MIKEEWKIITGASGYFISSYGRILSVYKITPRFMRPQETSHGYLNVRFIRNGRLKNHKISSLVAEFFIGKRPKNKCVCHNDGNAMNNNVNNLRYDTHAENMRDRKKHGTDNAGMRNGMSKFTDKQVNAIKASQVRGISDHLLSARYGVSIKTIRNIKYKKAWKHI